MTSKKIFDQFKKLTEEFILFSGQCQMAKKENGKFFFKDYEVDDDMFWATSPIDEDLINERFDEETEFDVKDFPSLEKEGFYLFEALLSYSPEQYGNYPPPNCEASAYYYIEHIEFEFIGDSNELIDNEVIDDLFPF